MKRYAILWLLAACLLAASCAPALASSSAGTEHGALRGARNLLAAKKPPPPQKKSPPPTRRGANIRSPPPPPPVPANQYDVVVIGAGVSGLAAANKLAKQRPGLKVIVLEGRDRIGGRTYSVPLAGAAGKTIDLGAGWVEGIGSAKKPNPVWQLASSSGLPSFGIPGDQIFAGGPGGPGLHADVEGKVGGLLGDFEDALEAWQDAMDQSEATDILDPKDNSMEWFYKKYVGDEGIKGDDLTYLRQGITTGLEQEYAVDISQLSALHGDGDGGFGGEHRILVNGYASLVNVLKQGLTIKTGVKVVKVDTSAAASVTVTAASGEKYTAKYVLCTMPLGYLQANHASIFTPALPAAKSSALKALRMGILNKIIMTFPSAWWASELKVDWLSRINAGRPGAWSEFYNLAATPAGLPTIIAFTSGTFANETEKLSDAVAVSQAYEAFKACFKPATQAAAKPPAGVHVTRWGSDPWTLGSYSVVAPGGTNYAYKAMAAPVGRLLFAGEHTESTYPQSVPGAYISGIREADRLLSLLK